MLCWGKQESSDRNSKFEKINVISVAIFELVIQFTFNVPFELNFGEKRIIKLIN